MKILGLVPARGGSKGIPHKNLYLVNGKPLISYTITEAICAMEKGALDDVVVSTDDEEIAAVSRRYGANVPFMRPKELSVDNSKSVDCMIHAVEYFMNEGINYDAIMLLQPTSPLRTSTDIVASADLYKREDNESLISCYLEESISEYNMYRLSGNTAIALNTNHNKGKRRQDIEPLYVRNGAIFITDVKYMLDKHLVIGNAPLVYIMPKDRSINIDTIYDMHEAEWLVKENENR